MMNICSAGAARKADEAGITSPVPSAAMRSTATAGSYWFNSMLIIAVTSLMLI